MTRPAVILIGALFPLLVLGQGDAQVRAKADALFEEQRYAEAYPLYSQLVSLTPGDRDLNYRFGTCSLFGNENKEAAIGHLKFATEAPSTPAMAWYWLGRAYHLNYRFKEAQVAYQRFLGTGDKKAIVAFPVVALDKQCRNGEQLLSNLKEITVRDRMEVVAQDFFRFYNYEGIEGSIQVVPEQLRSSIDKKRNYKGLVFIPSQKGMPFYFGSYGKDGSTGLDIYRAESLPGEGYTVPVKLAGYINTDQDEDFAYLHPDGKTFYFSSKGHTSMGGYDVFKATYDRGLDAFGRPENLDFSVNTPDDDIFYLVDGEHKEACFASGRNSKQGMLHVYRVATAQQPVLITVFKGTFASQFDEHDRKAHIVVEDAVTRERVADVRTDMNGNYVLSVPRSGSFRYMVECGPSGKTHNGAVEVPKRDGARAFRQELVLERSGEIEKLIIRNYFETPLEDDLIALSLDEIKRRARLDITANAPVAQESAEEPVPVGDVMTRAGFTGDIDQAAAVALAREDAATLASEAADLDASSKEAFAIAIEAAAEADRTTTEANALVELAAASTEESSKNELMVEAARKRQRSREANLRARAAFRTGQDLEATAITRQQQASVADKLSTDVAAAVATQDDVRTLRLMKQLRERLEVKQGPNAGADAAERARQAVTDHEKTVARALATANAKRSDENELTDRVTRLKRERDDTRSRSRKEELDREIVTFEEQLGHLRNETRAAFDQVAAMDMETATLRGQASLTRHLTTAGEHGPGSELTQAQLDQLGQRIAGIDQRIAAITIDERFDAQIASNTSEVEARTFDWDLVSAANATGTDRTSTIGADRSTDGNAQQAANRTTTVQASGIDGRTTETATVQRVDVAAHEQEQAAIAAAQENSVNSGDRTSPATQRNEQAARSNAQVAQEPGVPSADNSRFLLENERAELVQLGQAERDDARRDSLHARVKAIDAELAARDAQERATAANTAEAETADPAEVDMARPVLSFTPATKDAEIVRQLFADYKADSTRLQQIPDADERASGVNGLELMLADSIKAEMTRQVAVLQLSPQMAEQVLPRVDRLRRLREQHLAVGEQALAARRAEVAGISPTERAVSERAVPSNTIPRGRVVDAINDRFIEMERYAENVYASKLEHRSTARGMDDAIAFKHADVARMDALTTEIDSLEDVLERMPVGRDRDKLRKSTDQRIDERMIIRTDLGQRSAFLTREEWKVAKDSLDRLNKTVASRGIAPDEPLMLMAQGMQADAKRGFERATQLRKRADRIEDIVARDSLYREAYRTELEALREIDRSITVSNHLIGDDHQRGESLTYEEVASKVLGMPLAPAGEPLIVQETSTAMVPETIGSEGQPLLEQDNSAIERDASEAPVTSATPAATVAERSASMAEPDVESASAAQEREEANLANNDNTAGALAVNATATETTAAVESSVPLPAVADQMAQLEQRLTSKDRIPAQLYEGFLGSEGSILPGIAQDPEMEPRLLGMRAERAQNEASDMERRSVDLADQATLFADSATKAKRRDRERLELLAARTRALSDSLHQASVAKGEEARTAQEQQREAEKLRVYRDRLVKFYYLTPEEQALVMEDQDRSRYFQAKTRALEQLAAADDATGAARSNREVGELLQQQARAVEADAVNGRLSAAEAAARALVLDERASTMYARADSLDNVAARLRGAAGINESQASVMLQGMPPEASSSIMSMEMRARRSESLLAEAHDQAGREREVVNAQPSISSPARPEVVQPSSLPRSTAQPATLVPEALPFRMPDELAEDIFQLLATTERRSAPIPMDAAMPAGIVFKVQIGAFRKPVPVETFSDMSPVMGETVGEGLVRYTAGLFTGFDRAAAAKETVRERGYRDAFVVAYRDGKRISLGEAMRAERAATTIAQRPTSPEPEARPIQQQAAAPAERTATNIQQPVTAPAQTEPDLASVLAAYPATAEEVIARHAPSPDAAAYYNVPGAAPARQVEMVKGLFFTVQVGVYSKPVPLDRIFNLAPLNSERTETAKVRYTTGIFLDTEKARLRKDEAVALGVKDAFVTAYLNGKRIPMREANALLLKFGPAILAKP
ncbi:MAG: PD40 domain-containing protein [Flavobacteriales bacterium]|nr:PD40 domain-containing protein [Flavobacteriales bacterium]